MARSTVPAGNQTAAERRAADAKVRELIAAFSPGHLRLINAMRRSLQGRLPTAHEVVYGYRDCFVISYSPSGHGYEGVLAIRGSAEGVRLYFNRGKELPDPERVLEESGGLARFVAVERASTLARPAVTDLIEAAIARNTVPFAAIGRGSVVIRTDAASKSPRQRPA